MTIPRRSRRPFNWPAVMFYSGLVMLVLSLTLLGAARMAQREPARVAVPAKPIGLQTPIAMGQAEMQVYGVKRAGNQPGFAAPTGQEFLVVDFGIKNRSEAPINIFPTTDTYLKDAGGHVFYVSPYALAAPFRAGELLPGEQIRGELSYQAPIGADVKFYVESAWSGGTIPFAITP